VTWSVRFSKDVRVDIEAALRQTFEQFGSNQVNRYADLIQQAIIDIAQNPKSAFARHHPELGDNYWTFHIARRGKRARHVFYYRIAENSVIELLRLLYDAMDPMRHIQGDFDFDDTW